MSTITKGARLVVLLARPTEEEAGGCQSCIDRCIDDHFAKSTNSILYDECRQGCFATYFPQYTIGRSKNSHRYKEHVPGLPPRIRNSLGGHLYPVEKVICELSCRAQGADSILSIESAMGKCVDTCKRAPTPREQELQMSLDCAGKCLDSSETCIQPCIREHAQSRAPVTSTPTLNAGAGNVTFPLIASSKARSTSTRATSASTVVASDEQIPTSTSVTNSSSEVPSSKEERKPASSHTSSATGQSYFDNIWFWVHAAGTIVTALIIGLQVV
ncbi:hypothetical protein BDD12DRAFT_298656 [Trichophaea hybrida]|nr:hypothetical protein BDD12DRAFT_298656 [Trichophaea hybrida]